MPLVINTNTASITAQRHLDRTRSDMEQAMERLSSGKRINSAMDDAAGLTISHSLESKITSLNQATRNANDGISLINLTEGALDEVTEMLIRMRELAIQSTNGTYSESDRANLDLEFQELKKEITRVSENTFFNGIEVLNSDEIVVFQVGGEKSDQINLGLEKLLSRIGIQLYIDSETSVSQQYVVKEIGGEKHYVFDSNPSWILSEGRQVSVSINGSLFVQEFQNDHTTTLTLLADKIKNSGIAGVSTSNYNLPGRSGDLFITTDNLNTSLTITDIVNSPILIGGLVGVKTDSAASDSLDVLDESIGRVDSYRASLGAVANRLAHAANNLMTRVENQSAARSRIEDADYAVESANLAKAQVLQQSGTAMLSQANASTQNVLDLLK